jgi:hypothetical protein
VFRASFRSRLRATLWKLFSEVGRQTPRAPARSAATIEVLKKLDDWDGPVGCTHPRCFLGSQSVSTPEGYRDYALRLANQPAEPLIEEDNLDGDALEMAFAYAILRDTRLLDAALAQVERILKADTWVWHQDLQIDLHSSMVTSSVALIYDLLYPELTEAQRDRIISGLLKRDLGRYESIVQSGSDWWVACQMNWQAVVHSHIGIAALAISERLPNYRRILAAATSGVLGFLDAQPVDGSNREGLQYWHFGVGEAVWFGLALKTASRRSVNPLLHPYLQVTGEFARHMSTPDGCFDFEDCYNFRADDWLAAILSRECNSPRLRASPFDLEKRPFRKVCSTARAMRHIVALERTLPEEAPIRTDDGPTSRYFEGTGTVCMRSDWGQDATCVAFHAGITRVPHSHLDTGSFIIGSRGKRLLPDAGFWPYGKGFFDFRGNRWDFDGASSAGHNVLLVDGDGPRYATPSKGHLLSVDLASDCDRMVCDLSSAYGKKVLRYVRYFVFLHPNIVILLDDVEGRGPRYYKWNFQIAGSATIRDSRVDILNGGAAASIVFCNLDRQRGYRMTEESRVSYYTPFVSDPAWPPPSTRSVSVGNLHRESKSLLGTVVLIGEANEPQVDNYDVRFSLDSPNKARIVCSCAGARREVMIDLSSRTISVGAG